MLEHFHGLQYADKHQSSYQGLDVQKDIEEGRVTPGQFFVLKFDFSPGDRSSNVDEAGQFLKDNINQSLETFYETYSTYLGEDANKLCKSLIPKTPVHNLWRCFSLVQKVLSRKRNKQLAGVQGIYLLVDECDTFTDEFLEPNNTAYDGSAVEQVFKSFWLAIKSLREPNGIEKVFVTGTAPLSLDVHEIDFLKSEEIHRDSFYFSLLRNPSLRPQVEFQLTKPNKRPGRADIVLRVGNHLLVMKWKVLPIDSLGILIPRKRLKKAARATERQNKASLLSTFSRNKVLDINFNKNDKFPVGKLKEWIIDSAAPQLKSYVISEEVKKQLEDGGLSLKANLVIIVGSRQILVWDMDRDGNLSDEPDLVE